MGDVIIRNIKKTHLLLFIFYLAFIIAGTTIVLYYSANYQKFNGMPRNINAVVDFQGYDGIEKLPIDTNLSGKWEFFYNRWIITDSDTTQPDGIIKLPGRWTGMKINGQKLPKTGYASYRLTVLNVGDVENAFVHFMSPNIAYRSFINGQLTAECGVVSKDRNAAKAGHTRNIAEPYNSSGEESLTIVVEISNNNQGGLLSAPLICIRPQLEPVPAYEFLVFTLPMLMAGGMFVAFLFCAFMPVRTLRGENRLVFSALALMLLLHYLTTKDAAVLVVDLFLFNGMFLPVLRYITAMLWGVAFILYLHSSKAVVLNKMEKIIIFSINTVAFIAYFALTGSVFQIAPIVVSVLTLIWVAYKMTITETKTGYLSALLTLNLFMFTGLLCEATDSQGLLSFGFESFFSFWLFFILLAVIFLNSYKMRENDKMLLKAAQLDAEVANMKRQSLKAQIKPHFIFNSLTAIKDVYRKDKVEGEEMLTRFSQHLRANVDSDEKELIPFEEELTNMLNYFELENLRCEKKLNLILNVEYTDFSVPVLSLQPLLENAVKYAGTQEIENGYIQISSVLNKDGSIVIEVSDNGRGFEPANIRSGAVGIKNATKRLEYGLNASVTINSAIGAGTAVTILVPAKSDLDKANGFLKNRKTGGKNFEDTRG